MPRIAQAQSKNEARVSRAAYLAATVVGALCLAGCGAGGFSLKQAEVDRSIVTGSVAASPGPAPDASRQSDEAIIRNAVSAADLEGLAGRPLPWANAATGARGEITNLAEAKMSGITCRSFRASRQSFDGVRLYTGAACMDGQGGWRLEQLAPV
ncbi:MAG: RT0821/Lpp0805 family surface protein [Rhizobiaceae bacterium]